MGGIFRGLQMCSLSLLSPHRMFTDCFWMIFTTPPKMCAKKANDMRAKKNVPVIGWRRTYIR